MSPSNTTRKRGAAPRRKRRPAAPASPAPLSLRAYAKLRRVSPEAVSKAISSGRLRESVSRVGGAPKIADAALADREWEANTQQRVDQPAAPRDTPEYLAHRTAREAAGARREAAQAELAELELAERKGLLVNAEQARADVHAAFSLVKTRLLGVPIAVGQRIPELADQVVPIVDELIREALTELSARGETSGLNADDDSVAG